MKKAKAIVSTAVALGTFFAGLLSAAAAQPVPAGAVACYFAGRAYLNLMPHGSGQGQVVEYFININGISGPLFKGPPSESTAFFTLRSNLFSFTPVRPDGDIVLQLVEAGTFDIYYNPTPPNRDWSNLDQFSSGQLVARFARPESLVLQILQTDSANPPPFESLSNHPVTGTLMQSQSFTFKGQKYDFSDIVPGGITHNEFISNTGVAGIAGFPIWTSLCRTLSCSGKQGPGLSRH